MASFEDLGIYALLAFIWVVVPLWVIYKIRSRRTPARMKATAVNDAAARVRREQPVEIDAEYGRDYRGPGRKGEPFFQIGGLAIIDSMILCAVVAYLLSPYVHAIADWLVPVTRSPR